MRDRCRARGSGLSTMGPSDDGLTAAAASVDRKPRARLLSSDSDADVAKVRPSAPGAASLTG